MEPVKKECFCKAVQDLLAELKSATDTKGSTALFNRVTYILTHDRNYTKEARASVAAGAKASFGLTSKQKKLNLPDVRDEEDRYTDEDYYYEGCEDYGSYD